METSLAGLLHRRAEDHPDRVALTFRPLDDDDPATVLSYGDLARRSSAVAAALGERVRAGDRVVLLMPTGPEFAAAFLGCLAAGVIAVPLPLPVDEAARRRVAGVLRDCEPALIVATSLVRQFARAAPEQLRGLPPVGSWLIADELPEGDGSGPVTVRGADIAFLQYTSGSTSAPRGVLVSHGALLHNEAAIGAAFGVCPDSTVVSWLPLHHDMGLIGGLLQPLYAGARGVLLDPSAFLRRPLTWLEAVAREHADISGGPNFAYEMCVRKISATDVAQLDLSAWRVAFNGAGQVHPRTLRAFAERFAPAGFRPQAHTPCYGLAEATLLVTAAEPGSGGSSRTFSRASLEAGRPEPAADGPAARELAGYPLPGHTSVTVIDPDTGMLLADGRTGEIVVAGPSNGSGYWGGQRTAPAAPVRTGDLGFVHDGELFLQGRQKDLIVHRGRNIHPEDLEADISACHPGVRPGCGAVFAIDRDGDEAVVVCQEIRPETPPASWPEIAGRIRATVALVHGLAVRTVLLVAPRTVTKTSSGKIQRGLARRRYLAGELTPLLDSTVPVDGETVGAALVGPFASAGHLTDALCDYLQARLGVAERPAPGDALTAWGVDSLVAIQLQHELETALGVTLPMSAALRSSSIAELAARALAAPRSANAPAGGGAYELTQAQRALWFLHRVDPGSTAYNVTRAFRVVGELDADALDAALTRLVERHPSLRLSIRSEAGEPRGELRAWPVRAIRVDATTWDDEQLTAWYREFAGTPFDLATDHLLRAAILRRAGDAVIVLSLHHIVCDIASLTVLLAELPLALAGEPLDSADPGEFSPAGYERAVLDARGDELAAYWKAELDGELPVLALPKAAAGQAGAGALQFTVSPGVTAALTEFARRSGLTLHNVLLTAYEILLHRLSGQPDVLVGIPAAGRTDPRLAATVGYLVNVVPVRSGAPDSRSFAEHAAATQERVLDALDHQEMPLAQITRLVNPNREAAGATIFQAMFSFYGSALPGGAAAAGVVAGDPAAVLPLGRTATLHGFPLPDATAQCDLGLNAVVRAGVLSFELQHDPRRVNHAQADRLAGALRTLLEAVAADPRTPAVRLPLLSAAEAGAAVAAGRGPRIERVGHYVDAVEQHAARRPDALAADDGERTVTYAELDERANHVAARLRELGAGVDRNVVVCARRSVDYLAILLGIHKADACYVPISPIEAPRRAAAMIATTKPVAVIADEAGQWLLDEPVAGPVPVRLADLVAGRRGERVPRLSPDHAACTIIHTSGSTGLPKAAVSTNYGVTNHMWQMVEHFDLGEHDCVAQTGPVSFDISVWQLLTPLIVGGLVRIVPEPASQSPAKLLAVVAEGAVTMLELVPSAIVALLDAGLAATPGRLNVMLSTGEALTPEVLRRWVAELPAIPVHNAYGPAECTDDVTAGICAAGPDGPLTPSIGWPLANTTVHVLDEELAPVPPGVTGLLHVGWGAVGRGYRGDPRRTAEKFVPDPYAPVPGGRIYRTGDLGRRAPDGSLDFLGRADSQTKVRGLRIEAGEIESALRQCPGVTAAALRVHPGAAGAVLAGYVVLGEPADEDGAGRLLSAAEDERMRAALAEHLPRFMIPTLLIALPRLPRSKNGKVDYKALRYAEPGRAGADVPGLTDDPLATAIRGIWSAMLGTTVGWQDSFFALGGHSLLALAMVDRVGELLDVEVPVDTVFTGPRLAQFVAAIRRADRPRGPGSGPRAGSGGGYPAPASAAQERFWFLRERDPDQPTYNMPGVLRIRGELDEDALEAALREVLDRHPVLRARFVEDADGLRWAPGPLDDFDLPRLDLRGAVAEFGLEAFTSLAETEAAVAVDLRRELPFRAMLARLGVDEWSLLVVVDHIVCDGWSLSVFLSDLAAAYDKSGAAMAPEYTFADYCHDEFAWRQGRHSDEVLAEWRAVADGPLARAPLAAGPTGLGGTGQVVQWIEADLAAAVRALAERTGTTPYMVFATALAALTHSGADRRETVLLGTLIAQRDRPEWRAVIGPLLTVGVLAVDLAPDDPAAAALRRTRNAALRAYRCAHVPFQELAPLFPAAPGGDGSPFEVLLVLQPPETPVAFAGLTTELEDLVPETAAYPLVVDIEQRGDRYRVSWRYAADRYTHAAVTDLSALLGSAVQATADDPERPVRRLRTPDPGEALHAEPN